MIRYLALFFCLSMIQITTFAQSVAGDWYGILNAGGQKNPVTFHLTEDGQSLSGTVDFPGAEGKPLNEVKLEANSLTITMMNGAAKYTATYSPEEQLLRGFFEQNGFSFPMAMAREKGKAPEMRRPQEPIAPFPYETREVSFENKDAGITLSGTITTQGGDKKYPTVVLISGSGPQDRNSEMLGHKPFLLIADRLTRQGFTVLRFDERGIGKSTGVYSAATTEDFADDVEAAVNFLVKDKHVDKKKIVLMGHSEGGIIAPMVAARNKRVAAVVMLGGPVVRGDETIVDQSNRILIASGMSEEEANTASEDLRATLNVIIAHADKKTRDEKLKEHFALQYQNLTEAQREAAPSEKVYIMQNMMAFSSAWYQEFVRYNPMPTLNQVKVPVYALYGSKDLQVAPDLNMPVLEAAKQDHWKLEIRPNLNHLFQPSETGAPEEYGRIETTFDEDSMVAIAQWLHSLWP